MSDEPLCPHLHGHDWQQDVCTRCGCGRSTNYFRTHTEYTDPDDGLAAVAWFDRTRSQQIGL